jgi:cell division protein FtsB
LATEKHTVNTRQSIFLSFAVVGLFTFLLVIIFGDKGLADLHLVKLERDRLVDKNQTLLQENLARYAEKDRLENDPHYIEHVARSELGLVAADELVFITPGASAPLAAKSGTPQP